MRPQYLGKLASTLVTTLHFSVLLTGSTRPPPRTKGLVKTVYEMKCHGSHSYIIATHSDRHNLDNMEVQNISHWFCHTRNLQHIPQ